MATRSLVAVFIVRWYCWQHHPANAALFKRPLQTGCCRRRTCERRRSDTKRGTDAATRLGRSGAQPALVVALAKRHPPRAQDVVGGDGVEMEVGQREREEEGLRR